MSISLRQIGNNQVILSLPHADVFFSFSTPVAACIHGKGYVRTSTRYSKTTVKHAAQWLRGINAQEVPQEEIDALLK